MKKVNLLSKAEMKNVMGGVLPGVSLCAAECAKDGDSCKNGETTGRCTFYAASPECPNGEFACII